MARGLPVETLVRAEGFEPPRPFGHQVLNLKRPIPRCPIRCHNVKQVKGFDVIYEAARDGVYQRVATIWVAIWLHHGTG